MYMNRVPHKERQTYYNEWVYGSEVKNILKISIGHDIIRFREEGSSWNNNIINPLNPKDSINFYW